MRIEKTSYVDLPEDSESVQHQRFHHLRRYTNPEGDTFWITGQEHRQLQRLERRQNRFPHTTVSWYLAQTETLPTQNVLEVFVTDQQVALPFLTAYDGIPGNELHAYQGSLSDVAFNSAAYRLATYTDLSGLRFSATVRRELYPDIPESQGGDLIENGHPEEALVAIFAESPELSFYDFCMTFGLDATNMPEPNELLNLLQIYIAHQKPEVPNIAPGNHRLAEAGNLVNNTLPLAEAKRRYRAAKLTLEEIESSNTFSHEVYANPSRSSDLDHDPMLSAHLIHSEAKNEDWLEAYQNLERAHAELEASLTYANLRKQNSSRRKGIVGTLPETFQQRRINSVFEIPRFERPYETLYDQSPNDDYHTQSTSEFLLRAHFSEYETRDSLYETVTTHLIDPNEDNIYLASNSHTGTFEFDFSDLANPQKASEYFQKFWIQTRQNNESNKGAEWVCHIEYTDRQGLDPVETSFTLVLEDLGVINGMRRFNIYRTVDSTDYRVPTVFKLIESDLQRALTKMVGLGLKELYPNEQIQVSNKSHFAWNESLKPSHASQISESQTLNDALITPWTFSGHNHNGDKRVYWAGERWFAGIRLPFLGNPIVRMNEAYQNHVNIIGRSVIDYDGVFYVVVDDFDPQTHHRQSRIVEVDPFALQIPYSTDVQQQVEESLAVLAPYLSQSFYTQDVELDLDQKNHLYEYLNEDQKNYAVVARDTIPTHKRLVEMSIVQFECVVNALAKDLENAKQNGEPDPELAFLYAVQKQALSDLKNHYQTWVQKYETTKQDIQHLDYDEQNRILVETCSDIYQSKAFLVRQLSSVDLVSSPTAAQKAPTAFAVAMATRRALVTSDLQPINKTLAKGIQKSPFNYANTVVLDYNIANSNQSR